MSRYAALASLFAANALAAQGSRPTPAAQGSRAS